VGPISPMFDPETVLLMRQVVDEVWVKASPHYSALEPNQAAAAKDAIC